MKFPSKSIVKLKLKQIARQVENFKGCPWVLESEYADKYGLPRELPIHLKTLIGEWRAKKAARSAPKERRPREPKKPVSRFPVEDLLLSNTEKYPTERMDVEPAEASDFTSYSSECVPDLLFIYDFFGRFGAAVQLSKFPLNLFEEALCSNDRSTLIDEMHRTLYECLRADNEDVMGDSEFEVFDLQAVRDYIEMKSDEADRDIIEQDVMNSMKSVHSYYRCSPKHLLSVLRYLVQQALQTACVRDAIKENLAEYKGLASKKRKRAAEDRKKLKMLKDDLKEEKTKLIADKDLINHVAALTDMLSAKEAEQLQNNAPARRPSRREAMERKKLFDEAQEKQIIKESHRTRYGTALSDWRNKPKTRSKKCV